MNRRTKPDEKQRELPLFVEERVAVPRTDDWNWKAHSRIYCWMLRTQANTVVRTEAQSESENHR